MRFLELDLAQRIPDAKTIWLFRETLAQAKVVESLFAQFETYLAEHGLQPRGGQLIDASLIPVPKQHNTRRENAVIKAEECPTAWDSHPAKRRQKDTDARWTMKYGENHYGYKNHVNVDKTHKLIRQYTITDAAVHDSQMLGKVLLSAGAGREVWADSAHRSDAIVAHLHATGLRSKMQRKGYRHTPLTTQQKALKRGR